MRVASASRRGISFEQELREWLLGFQQAGLWKSPSQDLEMWLDRWLWRDFLKALAAEWIEPLQASGSIPVSQWVQRLAQHLEWLPELPKLAGLAHSGVVFEWPFYYSRTWL